MSARTYVADLLDDALNGSGTDYRIVSAPVELDGMEIPTVVVYREEVRPSPVALGYLVSTVAVWVLVPQQDPRAAEDPLDDALSAILQVLDDDTSLTWTEAQRGTYADRWPSYKVTVTIIESR